MTRAELGNYGHFLVKALESQEKNLDWYMRHPKRDEIDRKIEALYSQHVLEQKQKIAESKKGLCR